MTLSVDLFWSFRSPYSYLARAGLDPHALAAGAERDADSLEALIADNEQAHAGAGHWGVPTFVFEDEPIFGQDRIDLLLWRPRHRGLRPRATDPS